jgi:hypothetical protein
MKHLTLFLYVDALNSEFVDESIMPFLHGLTRTYYRSLENVIGYSFAIQSSMLGGDYSEENDHWMPYYYSPEAVPIFFKAFSKLSSMFLLDKFPKIRCLALEQFRRLFYKKGAPANNIPSSLINKIGLYPYYYMCELPFFDELRAILSDKCNTRLTYLGPPGIKDLYPSVSEYISASNNEKEFILAYDDKLDILGHKYGPNSKEYLNYVVFLDCALSKTYARVRKRFGDNLTFIVFSDHGQCQQTFEFDILSALRNSGVKMGMDCLCFVDATLALFWPKTETAKGKIVNLLESLNIGRVLDEEDKARYRIRFKTNRFGDIVFVLKPGGTFFPNFFSPFGTLKGLHGYLPEDAVQKAFLIANKDLSYNFSHVKDFRGFALDASINDS